MMLVGYHRYVIHLLIHMIIMSEIIVLKLHRTIMMLCYHHYMNDERIRNVYHDTKNSTRHTAMFYVMTEKTNNFYFTVAYDECTQHGHIEASMVLVNQWEKDYFTYMYDECMKYDCSETSMSFVN